MLAAQLSCNQLISQTIRYFIGVALLCVGVSVQGQSLTAQIDSLKKLLSKPDPVDNTNVYIQLSLLYQAINPQQAYQYAIRAYDLAEKNNQKKLKIMAILQMGECYLAQSKPQDAFSLFQQAYMLANVAGDTMYTGIAKGKMGVALYLELQYEPAISYLQNAIDVIRTYPQANAHRANFLNTLSYIYSKQGAYVTAIEYARSALEIRQRIDPTGEMTARSFTTLGEFYLLQNNLRKAMEYFNSALQINQRNHNKRGVAIMLTHIGNVYLHEGNYKAAMNNLLAALEIKKAVQAPLREIAITHLLLGKVCLAEKRPEKAYVYLDRALEAFSKVNDRYNMSAAYSEQAKCLAAFGKYQESLQAHQRGINIAIAAGHQPLVVAGYESLAETYLLMNDARNFFKYYKLYRTGKDSLEKHLKAVEVVLLQEELDRRKQELQQLASKNKEMQIQRQQEKAKIQRNFSLFIAALAVVVTIVVAWLLKARLKDKERLEQQNELISRQNRILEEQKKQLEELISTKDKLFSIVTHDIRSPLAGLSSMLQLLESRQISLREEDTQSALQQIGKALSNVYQLLNNLLDWARLQTGTFAFEPVHLPLIGITRKVVELFKPQADSKNITIINQIPSDVVLFADKNMLEFILRNVISNAIKFTFPNKKIVLTAEKMDYHVTIQVKDNGIGLTEEEVQKIFTLPVSKVGTMGERGAGIALSICAEFMEKHSGRIWATPNPEGGTIFHMQFPVPTAAKN
ncbi:MAG: tetratricopeptide repeat-containing sensor histidine kinase [Cytophagales bacterium]|nr:tetratricopeptide repeat-containing sensor histidine kinase [Bernardetiaceae bacterium]MDW8205244.1 tetratricopeptide repeat-containing sensor histidine kinase [Cytophagales bacterium]